VYFHINGVRNDSESGRSKSRQPGRPTRWWTAETRSTKPAAEPEARAGRSAGRRSAGRRSARRPAEPITNENAEPDNQPRRKCRGFFTSSGPFSGHLGATPHHRAAAPNGDLICPPPAERAKPLLRSQQIRLNPATRLRTGRFETRWKRSCSVPSSYQHAVSAMVRLASPGSGRA
jgi:hypothetical protein